eukprot:TRINITY_DN98_c0_g1_i1.p1 TRINITY_DN98_c0_g1~~TRINITY_DN98_c0_g1_i1.p1  ORF type:complete len:222 (-),score=60.09 TRINITY_DN98_c0_g1_i1:22-687(-)
MEDSFCWNPIGDTDISQFCSMEVFANSSPVDSSAYTSPCSSPSTDHGASLSSGLFYLPTDLSTNSSDSQTPMETFPPEQVSDLKHLLYNLLVDNYNNPDKPAVVQRICVEEKGTLRNGFRFVESMKPHKVLPELYAQYIRRGRLDMMKDSQSVLVQDLYKYYLRSCLELLGKYFQKTEKYVFLYEEVELFVEGSSIEDAQERIKTMKTRSRSTNSKKRRKD